MGSVFPVRVALTALAFCSIARAEEPEATELQRGADLVIERLVPKPQGTIAVAVLATPASALGARFESALMEKLARRRATVIPLRGAQLNDAEGAARSLGADWLLRVIAAPRTGSMKHGDPARVTLSADLVPTWVSFFLQRSAARNSGAASATLHLEADQEMLALLAHPGIPVTSKLALQLRSVIRLSARVLALAVGDVDGDGKSEIAALTPSEVVIVRGGAVVARRAVEAPARAQREPAGAIAIGDFGGGRVGYFAAGSDRGEVLEARGAALRPIATLAAAPLCSGPQGTLYGRFRPGKWILGEVTLRIEPRTPGASSGAIEIAGATAAPRVGRPAFALLDPGGVLTVLDPQLKPIAAPIPNIGSGFALADLDGDGRLELVASSATASPFDSVRALDPFSPSTTLFESGTIAGTVLVGAGGDVTGDGMDDAVLGAILPSGETDLYVLSRQ